MSQAKILRVPEEVAVAIEETARLADVPTPVVLETALLLFSRLDMELRRQLVSSWWAEGVPRYVDLEKQQRKRGGWLALACTYLTGWRRQANG